MATWILAEVKIISNKIPDVLRDLGRNTEDALYRIGEDVANKAKSDAPIDTGALKQSISVTTRSKSNFDSNVSAAKAMAREGTGFASKTNPPENAVDVHAPTHYAAYQELGTRLNAAHPYLVPALDILKNSSVLQKLEIIITKVVH